MHDTILEYMCWSVSDFAMAARQDDSLVAFAGQGGQ